MEIRGYLKTSAIEWPGKISAVFFVPGCNFRCPFCYNRDLVLTPQKLPKFSEKEILRDLEKRKKWVDAVIVTGGEPTLQKDLGEFLGKVKNLGFLTRIYTNGSNPKLLKNLLEKKLPDAITMDIKGPLNENYSKVAGASVNLSKLRKSIQLILGSGREFLFATTVVPGIHDKKTLVLMAKQLTKEVQSAKCKARSFRWYLQTFQPKTCLDPEFEKIKPYSKMEMEKFLKAVKKIIPRAELR